MIKNVAAAQTHIRQAHEDRTATMESVLRDISRRGITDTLPRALVGEREA